MIWFAAGEQRLVERGVGRFVFVALCFFVLLGPLKICVRDFDLSAHILAYPADARWPDDPGDLGCAVIGLEKSVFPSIPSAVTQTIDGIHRGDAARTHFVGHTWCAENECAATIFLECLLYIRCYLIARAPF